MDIEKWDIIRITYNITNTGFTWVKQLQEYYPDAFDQIQDVDVLIVLENIKTKVQHRIAIELKSKDCHSSLFGHGNAGILIHELQDHYLNIYDECWIFYCLDAITDNRDIMTIDSIAFRRCFQQAFYNQDNAIRGIYDKVNEYTTKIPRVYYRNESDAETTIQRMLRQFNGFSDELIEELSHLMKGLLPKDIFPNIEKFLSGNLLRLWKDWYYNGIEPKQNTLADMLKRFFKVFPDHIRVSEIKRLCNVPDQNLASALKQLYEAGLIDKATITGNGRAYTEFWNKQLMPSKLPSIIKKATARPSEDNHYEFKSDEPI